MPLNKEIIIKEERDYTDKLDSPLMKELFNQLYSKNKRISIFNEILAAVISFDNKNSHLESLHTEMKLLKHKKRKKKVFKKNAFIFLILTGKSENSGNLCPKGFINRRVLEAVHQLWRHD